VIKTAYIRYFGDHPESINTATAEVGFNELGVKTIPFQGFGDIETVVDCGPEALVNGFIGDIHKAMIKMGLPVPPSIDYPEELASFYGRKIWEGTLDDIQDRGLHSGVFVKPRGYQKLFTGLLWRGDPRNRLYLAPYPKETPTYFSEPVTFVSEYRCFVLEGEILDVKHYRGDWSKGPDRDVVEAAVKAYQPYRAYAIDFGVLHDGPTVVVEVNDAFALGCYGLHPIGFARMIEARWEELTAPLV
jgi:ATP-grasp domain, R2K clade family 3